VQTLLVELCNCVISIIVIIIYLFQAAQPISQHNIHIEGKERKENNSTCLMLDVKTLCVC